MNEIYIFIIKKLNPDNIIITKLSVYIKITKRIHSIQFIFELFINKLLLVLF